METLPLDQIHDDPVSNARKVALSAEADAALTESIRANGLWQPILVRPNGNGHRIIDGHRRLRCARAAGLTEIPVYVIQMPDAWAAAASAGANMQRAPLHPLDMWRAVADLCTQGMELPQIVAALGLTTAQARRMDRLGRLHPDVMALIERTEIPDDRQLRVLASATLEEQAKALKSLPAGIRRDLGGREPWWRLTEATVVKRAFRASAIFEPATSGLAWEEDLFAQPGDEAFFTRDVKGFLKLQRAALEAEAEKLRARKRTMRIVEADDQGAPIVPKGFKIAFGADAEKPRADQTVFASIGEYGRVRRYVAVAEAAAGGAKKKATAAASSRSDNDAPAEPVARGPISKKGLEAIAAIKTRALRQRLGRGLAEAPAEMLVQLLLLAFCADNVRIQAAGSRLRTAAIPGSLLLPGGVIAPFDLATVRGIVAELLASLLKIGGPDDAGSSYSHASGDAAEWIGAAVRADDALPRFDTEEFLAFVNNPELTLLAMRAGLKASGTGAQRRAALAGNLPDWRPCAFGAPIPDQIEGAGEDEE